MCECVCVCVWVRAAIHMSRDAKHTQFSAIKGDLRTICRFSYMKVYKLITLGTKFKTLLSLGKKKLQCFQNS